MDDMKAKERVLRQTPLPKIIEGPHKAYLRQSLLTQMQKEGKVKVSWRKNLAWVCTVIMAMAVSAWAAVEIYKHFIVEESVSKHTMVMPDGRKAVLPFKQVISMEAKNQQEADQKHAMVKQAIKDGKYKLIKETEREHGFKFYRYEVYLPNGKVEPYNSSYPIDFDPSSLDINEVLSLIRQGKGVLVDTMKRNDGRTWYIYRVPLPNGVMFKFPSPRKVE